MHKQEKKLALCCASHEPFAVQGWSENEKEKIGEIWAST